MARITAKSLESTVTKLNELLGRPVKPYSTWIDTETNNIETHGNAGHILLDHNPYYGGAILMVMQANTGQTYFDSRSRVPLREMSQYLDGILMGLTMTK